MPVKSGLQAGRSTSISTYTDLGPVGTPPN